MAEQYADLAPMIAAELSPLTETLDYEAMGVLHWLDRNPQCVPNKVAVEEQLYSIRELLEYLRDTIQSPNSGLSIPTRPGTHFLAYRPWSDRNEHQHQFVVAGSYIVNLNTGERFTRRGFSHEWVVTRVVNDS